MLSRLLPAGMLLAALTAVTGSSADDTRWVRPVSDYPESLSVAARYVIERYSEEEHPLALVVAPDGGYATYWRCNGPNCRLDDEVYIDRAKELCRQRAHIGECLVHSVRKRRVWPLPPRFDKDIRSQLVIPWKHANRGPAESKGAIVHVPGFAGHRYPPSLNHPIAPYYLGKLNQNGYDTFRLNIAHFDYGRTDHVELSEKIRDTVARLRKDGYRKVFLNGQSRGAWEILSASSQGLGIDGALLFVPAAHGRELRWNGDTNARYRQAIDDFRELVRQAGKYPFLFVFFEGDEYDPGGRAQALDARAFLWPDTAQFVLEDPAHLAGHGAAGKRAFHSIYADCLEAFLEGEPVRFEECRTEFDLTEELMAATEGHIEQLGGVRLTGSRLASHLNRKALVPATGIPGWWGYHMADDGGLLQWFPGDYLTGNTLRAGWETDDDHFCVLKSPRLNRDRFCYRVYSMPSGNTGLVAPDGLAFVVSTVEADSPEDLPFTPGDWTGTNSN